MAHPIVEKLKRFGLHHGEKLAVGATSLVFVVAVVAAVSKPTIDLTPDQVKEAATRAKQNIEADQAETEILKSLEEGGLVATKFDAEVARREAQGATVEPYALRRGFVLTEPGAGLIRDDVADDLVAPYDLVSRAGRGSVMLVVLDENGEPVMEAPKVDAPKKEGLRKKGARGGGGTSSGMMGTEGGSGATQKKGTRDEEIAKRRAAEEARRRQAAIGGQADPEKEEPAKEEGPALVEKKELRGLRWVAVVGLLDHLALRQKYAKALKLDVGSAHPEYLRLDLERQWLDPTTGDWTDWEAVDRAANELVASAFSEQDVDEYTSADVRLEPLVGMLPYLRAGYWEGVHHRKLVSAERMKQIAPPITVASGGAGAAANNPYSGGGMPGGRAGYGASMGQGAVGYSTEGGVSSGGLGGDEGSQSGFNMGGDSSGMMGGRGGAMRGSSGALPEHTSEAETIMVRALDFTVEPDVDYRYRMRVVVKNPNKNHNDVAPGVDNQSAELFGPWSEPTDEVSVPADVSTYASRLAVGGNAKPGEVVFDVLRWNPTNGVVAYRSFNAAPGDIVGDKATVRVALPDESKDKPESVPVDFNSRQLMVDAMGGTRPINRLGITGAQFELPSLATLLRPDGSIVVRNQILDARNPDLIEGRASYQRALDDLGKKKESTTGGAGGMSGAEGGSEGR